MNKEESRSVHEYTEENQSLGLIGQERKGEGWCEGRRCWPNSPITRPGLEAKVLTQPRISVHPQLPERTAAALLEGEIISSRISRKIQPIIFL